MATTWPLSPWVEERRYRVSFALQVFPHETKADPSRRLLEAGRLAEALGFDAFFVSDHPAWGPECWMHLAALAVTTERIRLGVNVCCLLYRHPVMTARQAADLDNLSHGRLILGLGIGWDANEFANFGLPFPPVPERQAALEEGIAIIRGVWGPELFTFDGRYFRATGAHVTPPPVQRPRPPVMIAGGGERVTPPWPTTGRWPRPASSTLSSSYSTPPTRRLSACWPSGLSPRSAPADGSRVLKDAPTDRLMV